MANSINLCFTFIFLTIILIEATLAETSNSLAIPSNEIHLEQPLIFPTVQLYRDEFNSTESALEAQKNSIPKINTLSDVERKFRWISVKQTLLKIPLNQCCPTWKNLPTIPDIKEDLRKKFGKINNIISAQDLLEEIQQTFVNITYSCIDGQPGSNEAEKYYSFYEGVQYYLRLVSLAKNYLSESSDETDNFKVMMKRKLSSIETRVSHEPILSSFISELKVDNFKGANKAESSGTNSNFELYEDFIRDTKFGQFYAKNISMIRESVMVFNQICSHLLDTKFPGNFTRPSKQYEIIRRMSFELHLIKTELLQQINPRILHNHEDVKRSFAKLNELYKIKPYIRMLGDQFNSTPLYYSSHVRRLTELLDLYLTDSLTKVSFYNQLSDLPEDFIKLGSSIANDYEKREVPLFSKFNPDYYNWLETDKKLALNQQVANNNQSSIRVAGSSQDNIPFFTRFFT